MTSRLRNSLNLVLAHVRWWMLALSLGLILCGLLLLVVNVTEPTIRFLAGTLIGIGAGGALSEIASVLERKDFRERIGQLREPVLAQCRLAYRMGELRYGFLAAVVRSQFDDRHVREMLSSAELLGVRRTLEEVLKAERNKAVNEDKNLESIFEIRPLEEAMAFVGQHAITFFDLGVDIAIVRSDDNDDLQRKLRLESVETALAKVRGFTNNPFINRALKNVTGLWAAKQLAVEEIDALFLAIHIYLLTQGLDELGVWPKIVERIGRLKPKKTGIPKEIRKLVDDIQEVVAASRYFKFKTIDALVASIDTPAEIGMDRQVYLSASVERERGGGRTEDEGSC